MAWKSEISTTLELGSGHHSDDWPGLSLEEEIEPWRLQQKKESNPPKMLTYQWFDVTLIWSWFFTWCNYGSGRWDFGSSPQCTTWCSSIGLVWKVSWWFQHRKAHTSTHKQSKHKKPTKHSWIGITAIPDARQFNFTRLVLSRGLLKCWNSGANPTQ